MLEDEPTGGAPADQPVPANDNQGNSPAAAAPPAGPSTGDQQATAEPAKKAAKRAPRKAAAKKAPAAKAPAKAPARRAAGKKAAAEAAEPVGQGDALGGAEPASPAPAAAQEPPAGEQPATEPATEPAVKKAAKRSPRKTAAKRTKPAGEAPAEPPAAEAAPSHALTTEAPTAEPSTATPATGESPAAAPPVAPPTVSFLAPEPATPAVPQAPAEAPAEATGEAAQPAAGGNEEETGAERRRRRRGRRGRGRNRGESDTAENGEETAENAGAGRVQAEASAEAAAGAQEAHSESERGGQEADEESSASRRRRRRRRRGGEVEPESSPDDPADTVVRVRDVQRSDQEDIQGVKGSTRIEAKRQRRREGREQGRRRPPIITEAEFLARREAVDRVMVVRQSNDRTQIAVLEDDVLVEHYVTKASATSYAGNVYLGRVQNVLPSMEAAFVDIGKGRNAVLYAGEVNWDAAGMNGKPRKIEDALKPGQSVLVQVTKDPIAHKGARLTSQVSLPGRFLVYVPEGSMTGISRKLPDTERKRLKDVLRRVVPEDAGVIVRTAAEGASEEDLGRDVRRLQAQWEVISKKASSNSTSAPALLYAEPDLAIRVVRDVFNEDFAKLVVQGDDAWDTLQAYVDHVAPDLADRLVRHTGEKDVFADLRIDEQLMKALDRRVWLPSGGSLVIDNTEAMTVIDVNTGKFTGQGGNLEETVTRNNLEAAEEIVRQLRLRDIGGMIVVDFIDMVLEGNRDLVLRRLTECLGRDRTKHQVAEVTSLGLVQMTRKRVGQGLLEAFSETCEACNGRGVIVHTEPVDDESTARGGQGEGRRKRGRGGDSDSGRGRPKPQPPAKKPEAAPAEIGAAEVGGAEAAPAEVGAAEAPVAETVEPEPAEQAGQVEPPSAEPEEVAGAAARAAGVPTEKVETSAGASEEPEVEAAPVRRRSRRRAASRPAGPPVAVS